MVRLEVCGPVFCRLLKAERIIEMHLVVAACDLPLSVDMDEYIAGADLATGLIDANKYIQAVQPGGECNVADEGCRGVFSMRAQSVARRMERYPTGLREYNKAGLLRCGFFDMAEDDSQMCLHIVRALELGD